MPLPAPIRLAEHLAEAEIAWPQRELPELSSQLAGRVQVEDESLARFVKRVSMRGRRAVTRAKEATIGLSDRLALVSPDGGRYRFRLTLPEDAALRLGLGYIPPGQETGRDVRFSVVVGAKGVPETVLDERMSVTPDGYWRDREIELAAWAGQQVEIVLTTDQPGESPLWAAWAAPEIIARRDEPPARWTVILISIDTLRADRLGCYGNARETSPNLDALAARGVLFETAVSHSPWTRPSHRALLSGVYPNSTQGLSRKPVAWWLWKAGYRTWAVTGGGQVHPQFGFRLGFEEYRVADWLRDVPTLLDELEANAPRRQFLFLHTFEVHEPYRHTELAEGMDPGRARVPFQIERFRRWRQQRHPARESERQYVLALYDSGIAFVDRQLGTLFDGLAARHLLDTTLIFVTSDHGEEFSDHSGIGHGFNMCDHQIRIPLIAYLPPALRRQLGIPSNGGLVVTDQVRHVDLAPTLLDLLGVANDAPVQGRSLVPLLRGEHLTEVDSLAENTNTRGEKKSLRSQRFKFIESYHPRRGLSHKLYDLRADPAERFNLASERPELVAALVARLREITGAPVDPAEAVVPDNIDAELRQQLEALGYVNE